MLVEFIQKRRFIICKVMNETHYLLAFQQYAYLIMANFKNVMP
jgi:hypothetical protein